MKKVQKYNKNIVTNSVWNTLTNFFKCCRMKLGKRGDSTMTDAITLSRYIIHRFNEDERVITNLKLQKILYYIQGYFLKAFNRVAFLEKIYNWQYGPVVPAVYYEYKSFGASPIECFKAVDLEIKGNEKKLVDSIIDSCFQKTALELVSMTHSENPWKNSSTGEIIETSSIKSFFDYSNPLEINI